MSTQLFFCLCCFVVVVVCFACFFPFPKMVNKTNIFKKVSMLTFYQINVCDNHKILHDCRKKELHRFLLDWTAYRVTFYLPEVHQGDYFKTHWAKVVDSSLAYK